MKRTRKWSYVAQEASRLASIGLSPRDIAIRLEVNKSTITRWMKAGKLTRVVVSNPGPTANVPPRMAPAEWAKSVREEYALDATDDQLVTLGESALSLSRDMTVSAAVQLNAGGRFQAIVRQLALVTRRAAAEQKPEPAAVPVAQGGMRATHRRPTIDPRKGLMAIK